LGNEETFPSFNYGDISISLTEFKDIKGIIKKRARNSHKGTYGKVGIVSGSKGMAGAAVFNINAAMKSGSGIVKAFIPEEIYNVVESMALEAITCTYNKNDFSYEKLQKEIVDYSDVVATGSGCANLVGYKGVLDYLLCNCSKPVVIDAEGINRLNLNDLINHKQQMILTPHYGEMVRLLNRDMGFITKNIVGNAVDFSQKYNVYLILKGARTIIACPDNSVFINTSGNPGMATAGSGDVLTGIIASFIGQGIEIKEALRAAVYVHGLAGDIGAEHLGEHSLTASDIIRYLPDALMKVIQV
jgi:NAD(P)H-hydrate epimerase